MKSLSLPLGLLILSGALMSACSEEKEKPVVKGKGKGKPTVARPLDTDDLDDEAKDSPVTSGPGRTLPSRPGSGTPVPGQPAPTAIETDLPTGTKPLGFGPNVLIFDPATPMADIQAQLDQVFVKQEKNQFGLERYALFFKPGLYNLDVKLGFYTQVLGLGAVPDDVGITGAIRVTADWKNGNGRRNFWRSAENISVTPTLDNNVNLWAVSQGTALRRFHVKGSLNLWDSKYQIAWTSGGFIADSKVDATINSGSQQQFLTRNSSLNQWTGGNWNMVFVGDEQAPVESWPKPAYTVTPVTFNMREKPYIVMDATGKYSVAVPNFKFNTVGVSWGEGSIPPPKLPIENFYIAHAGYDTARSMNEALASGKSLILTPGVYHLRASLRVNNAKTIVMGLGSATLVPDNGTEAIIVGDVDDVTITGIVLDAGPANSPTLLKTGDVKTNRSHSGRPILLSDISCRIGGMAPGLAQSCVLINTGNTILDNVWLWRSDQGNGVGWDLNRSANGIIVNGDFVTAYGLFVEQFQEYQTIWNGNEGALYFYQSELPYDVPDQASWSHNGIKGYASLKVGNKVTHFKAGGIGVYCNFQNSVILENAVETPTVEGVQVRHIVTQWLGRAKASGINHLLNGTGKSVLQSPFTPGGAYSDQ